MKECGRREERKKNAGNGKMPRCIRLARLIPFYIFCAICYRTFLVLSSSSPFLLLLLLMMNKRSLSQCRTIYTANIRIKIPKRPMFKYSNGLIVCIVRMLCFVYIRIYAFFSLVHSTQIFVCALRMCAKTNTRQPMQNSSRPPL